MVAANAPRIDMIIKVGIGVDDISFGLTEDEIQKLLGKPDKVYLTDTGCRRLQFNKKLLELSFESNNDNRLGWIEVHNSGAELFNKMLIGLPEHEVVSYVNEHLSEQYEVSDYGSFISYDYINEWLELQFKFGWLKNINFGALYNDKDEPIWPLT